MSTSARSATETASAYPVRVERDVPAAMRDGTVLSADIYRPAALGPFPVLLCRTPYDKLRNHTVDIAERAAARGYIVVAQDIRGRCASDGQFFPLYSPDHTDQADGYDTVEWAATLPGSTGKVGTWGVSYNSWTQWQLAVTRPPHLVAMFPTGLSTSSLDCWPGVYRVDRQLQWLYYTLSPDLRRRLGLPGPHTVAEAQTIWDLERGKWIWYLPLGQLPSHFLGGMDENHRYHITHHHVDWFRFHEKHAEIDVPMYHATGWYDRLIGTIDQYTGMVKNGRTEQARRSQKLLVGPWSHGYDMRRQVGPIDFGPDADLDYVGAMAPWFDYWLKGIQNGIMAEPPIRMFVMGENRWRFEHEWPLARTTYTDYYLHSGGGANTPFGNGVLSSDPPGEEPVDRYTFDPRDPVMSIYLPNAQDGPGDQSPLNYRQDVLVFQTPPLESDMEVTGPIVVKLFAATSAPDTDWTAKLVDVDPSGLALNLTYGIQRARYRESFAQPSLLRPGQVYEYTLKLLPTGNLFKAGHRIRLDISSSDFPNFDRNHNTGLDYWDDDTLAVAHQTVYHDRRYPSRIILPVIPR